MLRPPLLRFARRLGVSRPGSRATDAVIHGGIVYVPPQSPMALSPGLAPQIAIGKQTSQVLLHLLTILAWAGSSLSRVQHVTVYIADSKLMESLDRAYLEIFGNHHPQRRVVDNCALPPGVFVKIEVAATVTNDRN